MGIYNRDYYKDMSAGRSGGTFGLDGLSPVVKWIIVANVAVFLLQIFIVREVRLSPLNWLRQNDPDLDQLLEDKDENDPEVQDKLKKDYPAIYKSMEEMNKNKNLIPPMRVSILQEWLELDTKKVVFHGQLWRLLTHAFCHDRYGVFHIVFNMLFLYIFGCTLESMYGSREFLLFYLVGAVVAAFAFVGLQLYTGSYGPAIGASGAVMAVTMLYTMHFPTETIRILWLIPIEMRWLMVFYVIFDLHPILLSLAGDRIFTGVANAAHLGGVAFGFAYAKFEWRLEPLADLIRMPRLRLKRRPRLRLAPETMPEPEPEVEMSRVDQILQKIYESGQTSLTDEERAILRDASERIKNRARSDR